MKNMLLHCVDYMPQLPFMPCLALFTQRHEFISQSTDTDPSCLDSRWRPVVVLPVAMDLMTVSCKSLLIGSPCFLCFSLRRCLKTAACFESSSLFYMWERMSIMFAYCSQTDIEALFAHLPICVDDTQKCMKRNGLRGSVSSYIMISKCNSLIKLYVPDFQFCGCTPVCLHLFFNLCAVEITEPGACHWSVWLAQLHIEKSLVVRLQCISNAL